MTYSAGQQEEISQIRKKYIPQKPDKMEQLRALDAGVTRKATVVSMSIGIIGALIMGLGMSLVMTDLGSLFGAAAFTAGIVTGVIGMILIACAYPLYNRTLKKEREKIAPEIIRLTDELMK